MESFTETSSGLLLATDGFSPPLRWDGSTASMEEMGLAAPTTAPTIGGSGSGAIVGTYYAYLRFVDRLGLVSNLSPIATAYTAAGTTGTITDASNATPIVVTSVNHLLSTGDVVKIEGIGGNEAANDTWIVTVVDADTFSLDDSHADGDYDGGGTWTSGVETITYTGVEVTTDPKVVRRQILRNTDGQADTFYVDVDTADLTSTTFDSTKDDTTLAAQTSQAILDSDGLPLANLHAQPPTHISVMCPHLDRMFGAVVKDEARGSVKVTSGSTTVYGVGTDWVEGLVGRFLYVVGAVHSYEISAVDIDLQTLTMTEAYDDVTDLFGVYAIRPAPAYAKTLFYTPAGLPESWPATYGLTIQEDGDKLTGLMTRGSFLYVLERRHIYKLTFQEDPAKDGAIFLSANRGCLNQRCWVLVDNDAYMLDEYGVHRFTGQGQCEPVSLNINQMLRTNSVYPYHINWKAETHFHAVLFRPQETIRWFVCLGGSYLPKWALTYNYRLNRWWLEEWKMAVGAACSGFIAGLPYVLLGAEHKKVLAMWEGTTDLVDPAQGNVRGTATSAGVVTLVDSTATFPTSGVVNAPITIVDGTGKGQTRRITAVSSTTLTVDQPWLIGLDTTSVYQIGGVNWTYKTSQFRFAPAEENADRKLEILYSPVESDCLMDLRLRTDFSITADVQRMGYSSAQGAGVRTDLNKADMPIDLTKEGGVVTKAMPGHRVNNLHGKKYVQVELAGTSNADPLSVYMLTLEGAGNVAQLSQGGP